MKFWKTKKAQEKDSQRNGAKSSNQRVYSYYTATKAQIDSYHRYNAENTAPKTIIFAKKLGVALLVLGLLGFLFFNWYSLKIDGFNYYSQSQYKLAIDELADQDRRYKIKYFNNSDKLKEEITKKYPEVQNVEVNNRIIGPTQIRLKVNDPIAKLKQNSKEDYLIDASGKAVAVLQDGFSNEYATINNSSNLAYKLGDQIFKPSEAEGLQELLFQLKTNDQIQSPNLEITDTPREIRLLQGRIFVKFNLDNSSGAGVERQYGAYKSIQKSIAEQGIGEPNEYIDVRLGEKVYIK